MLTCSMTTFACQLLFVFLFQVPLNNHVYPLVRKLNFSIQAGLRKVQPQQLLVEDMQKTEYVSSAFQQPSGLYSTLHFFANFCQPFWHTTPDALHHSIFKFTNASIRPNVILYLIRFMKSGLKLPHSLTSPQSVYMTLKNSHRPG